MDANRIVSANVFLSNVFHTFQSTTDRELWTFANLNLAIVYLRMKREGDFNKLIENINPETLPSHSHSLRAAAFYVQGLQCFFQARYNEAK
jgi:MAternally-affected-uncoordination protein